MKFKLVYAFVFLFLVGVVSAANNNSNGSAVGCKNLYWIDNEDKSCGQKEFCGVYMYQGLQTFASKTQCEKAVTSTECNVDKDCWDKNNESCYYKCNNNKCGQIQTITALPPYPYCDCGNLGDCDWKNNVSGCSKKCGNKTFTLSNGRKAEIKIMPETASERAIARLGELNFTVVLKEVGKNQTAYEVIGEKQGKMLGLFKVKANVSMQVDAETGEVLKTHKPWWAFLASGI